MKKIELTILALASLTILGITGCNKKSGSAANESVKLPKFVIIDYQGAAVGREIPAWIDSVANGDNQEVAKLLKLDNKKVWVLSSSGPDLDFLKIWTDKVEIQSEIAQSISSEIGRQTIADIEATQELDETTKKKAIQDTTTVLTNVRVNDFEKVNQYWIQRQIAKTANPKSDADYRMEYTYYVVYAMDAENYKLQVESALESVKTNTSQDSILQQIITARIANSLLPENQVQMITATDNNSNNVSQNTTPTQPEPVATSTQAVAQADKATTDEESLGKQAKNLVKSAANKLANAMD